MGREQIINQIVILTEQLKQTVVTDSEKEDAEELNQLAYCFANNHCDISKILAIK